MDPNTDGSNVLDLENPEIFEDNDPKQRVMVLTDHSPPSPASSRRPASTATAHWPTLLADAVGWPRSDRLRRPGGEGHHRLPRDGLW